MPSLKSEKYLLIQTRTEHTKLILQDELKTYLDEKKDYLKEQLATNEKLKQGLLNYINDKVKPLEYYLPKK